MEELNIEQLTAEAIGNIVKIITSKLDKMKRPSDIEEKPYMKFDIRKLVEDELPFTKRNREHDKLIATFCNVIKGHLDMNGYNVDRFVPGEETVVRAHYKGSSVGALYKALGTYKKSKE